jgi:predicted unusual protein kinase regulating ubiquinone biosynthesis (AarF/ABC1/UbiB family)
MLIKNILSGILQISLFLIVKLTFMLGLIKLSTYNKFLIWIIKFNGPISIKIFQVMSSTKDMNILMGPDFISQIKKLQDDVYPTRRRQLKTFDYSSSDILATGTVGQVYTIQLTKKKQGILKISHKNIEKEIKESISSFKLVRSLFKIINNKIYKLIKTIDLDEFGRFLIDQTNFSREANNIIRFNKIFINHEMVHVPKVIDHSKKYLVMSKESGMKIEQFINTYPEYKEEAVSLIYSIVYFMIKNQIIHGDLHFGNFLFNLNQKKKRVEITLLDFGITCPLTKSQSQNLQKFIKKKDNKALILFLKEVIKNVPDDLCLDEKIGDQDLLKNILDNHDVLLPSNFISLFSTLKIMFELHHECNKNNSDFNSYLAGYIMDNDFY